MHGSLPTVHMYVDQCMHSRCPVQYKSPNKRVSLEESDDGNNQLKPFSLSIYNTYPYLHYLGPYNLSLPITCYILVKNYLNYAALWPAITREPAPATGPKCKRQE
jgi:hypothetical protein